MGTFSLISFAILTCLMMREIARLSNLNVKACGVNSRKTTKESGRWFHKKARKNLGK